MQSTFLLILYFSYGFPDLVRKLKVALWNKFTESNLTYNLDNIKGVQLMQKLVWLSLGPTPLLLPYGLPSWQAILGQARANKPLNIKDVLIITQEITE